MGPIDPVGFTGIQAGGGRYLVDSARFFSNPLNMYFILMNPTE